MLIRLNFVFLPILINVLSYTTILYFYQKPINTQAIAAFLLIAFLIAIFTTAQNIIYNIFFSLLLCSSAISFLFACGQALLLLLAMKNVATDTSAIAVYYIAFVVISLIAVYWAKEQFTTAYRMVKR